MQLLPTATFNWTQAGGAFPTLTFQTAGYTTYPINTAGCDQLGLLVTVSGSTSAVVQVQWGSDNYLPSYYESTLVPGATNGIFQRFTVTPKEFGPITPAQGSVVIWLPSAAHCFLLNVYATATPVISDSVAIAVEMARTGTPTSP